MQVGILATEGGPHSAAQWAVVTAGQIIQIAQTAEGDVASAARRLELKILDILEEAHGAVQRVETDRLREFGGERLLRPMAIAKKVEAPFQAILKATEGTPFTEHFAQDEVQDRLRRVLGSHFATAMQIERSWHADTNPDLPEAQAFKAAQTEGPEHPAIADHIDEVARAGVNPPVTAG